MERQRGYNPWCQHDRVGHHKEVGRKNGKFNVWIPLTKVVFGVVV
jgi:hypothetical protein